MTSGLPISARFTSAGVPERLDAGDLSVIQYPGSEVEAGPHQIWLRRRRPNGDHSVLGLLGPGSGATVALAGAGPVMRGSDGDLDWCLWWDQPADGVFGWTLQLVNRGPHTVTLDAVCTLDVALTPWDALRRNEFYVSQYLDLTPLHDGRDTVLAVRQNLPGATTPWLALSCTRPVAGWCTDALQLAGAVPGTGLDLTADLPSTRLQHEHTLAGLQSEPLVLAAGEGTTVGFRVLVEEDHPDASSPADLQRVRAALAAVDWSGEPPPTGQASHVAPTAFDPPRWVHGEELAPSEFLALTGPAPSAPEVGPDGRPWAYDAGGAHVVAASKEMAVLRPHGHILVASEGPGPRDAASAVTVWMTGQVGSQLTRGHADADPLLSVRRSYLGLTLAHGTRLLVDDGTGWRLMGAPSAWAVTADSARWWWRWRGRTITARTAITPSALVMQASCDGTPLPLMLVAHADDPEGAAGDGVTRVSGDGSVELTVALGQGGTGAADDSLLSATPALHGPPAVGPLAGFLPWLTQDAIIHYQVPRGLEQFTGGAWGTRDVCQGPVGLLVATGRLDLFRAVLTVVFGAQQDNGDWPQWFEYLPHRRAPGHRDSHGDIVYWPLLALGEYLAMTGDVGILDEEVGWVGQDALLEPTPIRSHVEAAVEHLARRRSHDPRLPAYGHGDWNDSLQPADPELASWMTSTWTAELEIKALSTLAASLATAQPALSQRLEGIVAGTRDAVAEHLLVDGELAGYAIVDPSGVELLVHPRDRRTGLAHGSLQMIHALADELLTPQEALAHVELLQAHLNGPAGMYLFDRPVAYHGGELHMFVRAEAASFWGREIGLMYTHAHLRWVEALLRLGEAERAWAALQVVIPAGLAAAVTGVGPQQSNCYYSSVDARFRDRRDAQDRADRMFDPTFGFDGGWRVYSSGPGLILRMVTEQVLGLRWRAHGLVVDPVLPVALNGLRASVVLDGREVRAHFTVQGAGHGVRSVHINGVGVATSPEPGRYRVGGVLVPRAVWDANAAGQVVELGIAVG